MIDFISTREGVDPRVQQDAQIIAAFIALRLRDLGTRPTKEEHRRELNLNPVARKAAQYFFDPQSKFRVHIECVGGDADAFVEHLLGKHPLAAKSPFTDGQRRTIRLRHRWWLMHAVGRGALSARRTTEGETP